MHAVLSAIEEDLARTWHRPAELGRDVTAADLGRDGSFRTAVEAIHDPNYLRRLEEACRSGRPCIDAPDSRLGGLASLEAAVQAAAAALAAVDAVHAGPVRRAFVAMRPPGHHCERDRSMGFCLLANAAIAAAHALDRHGAQRVAIVDFDVHHGNGTQHIFEDRGDVLYVSVHQHPATLYPGTGHAWERGTRGTAGEGCTLNVPLDPGSGHDEAIRVLESAVLPALEAYAPGLLIVSAGFDADHRDPLGHLMWTARTYDAWTRALAATADRHAGGRLVSLLEGGYSLPALREDVAAHLAALVPSAS